MYIQGVSIKCMYYALYIYFLYLYLHYNSKLQTTTPASFVLYSIAAIWYVTLLKLATRLIVGNNKFFSQLFVKSAQNYILCYLVC